MVGVLATVLDSPALSPSPSNSSFSSLFDEDELENLPVNIPETSSWNIRATLTHSITPLLNPQNWSLQTHAGIALACVAPCAAVSLKVGVVVFTTIACLPKIAAYYSPTQTQPPETHQTEHAQETNLEWYLSLKIKWFKEHPLHEDVKDRQEKCLLDWQLQLQDPLLTLEEKTYCQGLILYYNSQIIRFHKTHRKALQTFKTSYLKWHTNLKSALRACAPFLNGKWKDLSIEDAKAEVAKECQTDLNAHIKLFQETLFTHLKEFYKNLLKIHDYKQNATPRPYISAQVNRVLNQAVINYLKLQTCTDTQLNQINQYILNNWTSIITSRQESDLPFISPCETCRLPIN